MVQADPLSKQDYKEFAVHKNTVIAIGTGAVAATCDLLDAYEIAPSLKPVYMIAKAPCYGFLFYYLIWRRRNSSGDSVISSQVWKVVLLLFRAVGWVFVAAGGFMLLFALSRIFDTSIKENRSGDWYGVYMSLFALVLGSVTIALTKSRR